MEHSKIIMAMKVFELIDRSPVLQRMAWAVIALSGLVALIHAVCWW
jgi:hypothetical protein